jgi:hypothetical protein
MCVPISGKPEIGALPATSARQNEFRENAPGFVRTFETIGAHFASLSARFHPFLPPLT